MFFRKGDHGSASSDNAARGGRTMIRDGMLHRLPAVKAREPTRIGQRRTPGRHDKDEFDFFANSLALERVHQAAHARQLVEDYDDSRKGGRAVRLRLHRRTTAGKGFSCGGHYTHLFDSAWA